MSNNGLIHETDKSTKSIEICASSEAWRSAIAATRKMMASLYLDAMSRKSRQPNGLLCCHKQGSSY
jgi:hypothetical protein